ncbi:diguanylate cyclase [Kineosporia sp. A_224]|uniref:GGDEF domain-containing protein n=1 Tax=Kineosporia sp. A_224 TaxID=1962180 RepID=UPI0026F42908|nr:GGDEF domain-containing protein [Kineosporia sp. A_224]
MAQPLTGPAVPRAVDLRDGSGRDGGRRDGGRVPVARDGGAQEVVDGVSEIVAVRRRAAEAAQRLDRVSAAVVGWGFVVAATGVAVLGLLLPGPADLAHPSAASLLRVLALVGLYVLAYRTEFVAASGSAVPTQPVLVALLLLTPLPLVPLAVLIGLLLGAVGSPRAGGLAHTVATRAVPGWHCVGAVAVLAVAGPAGPALAHWPVYVAAFAAQIATDAVVAVVRSGCLGVAPGTLVRPLAWTFAVDALLGAVGLAVVVAGGGGWATILLLAAPVGLVRLLAADGRRNLAAAVTLEDAYTEAAVQARHDALTGLANRRAWDEAVAAAGADGAPVAVLVADLDGLKTVNDALGHDAGDDLILAVAGLLRDVVPGAVVARLGGDEFGVLVRTGDPAAPDRLVAAVRDAVAGHPPVHGAVLSASVGAARCAAGGDVDAVVTLADARAGQDKVARRAGRRHGDPGQGARAQ